MSVLAERLTDTVGAALERFRHLRDIAAAVGIWAFIASLFLWFFLAETQLFAIGVIVGSVLALGAIGLTLIYGILKFANFAHGDTMMLGAYVAFFALTGLLAQNARQDTEIPFSLDSLPGSVEQIGPLSFGYGLILSAVVAAAVIALIVIGLDRLIYRPLRRRGSGIVIFAVVSLGLAISIRSVMMIFWGPSPRVYVTGIHPAERFDLGFTTIALKADQIFIFAVAVSLAALVYFVLFRTKLGKAMRAMADNPSLAEVSGINTDQIITWTWLIGGALVAIAGVLLALQAQLNPNLGFFLLLPLFASTILGGIGNPMGALLGGLIVGITQEVSVGIELSIAGQEILPLAPGYKFSVAVVILIFILLARPRGLLGSKSL